MTPEGVPWDAATWEQRPLAVRPWVVQPAARLSPVEARSLLLDDGEEMDDQLLHHEGRVLPGGCVQPTPFWKRHRVDHSILPWLGNRPPVGASAAVVIAKNPSTGQCLMDDISRRVILMGYPLNNYEFFKYRHLDENSLANAILHWKLDLQDFPTVICGHSHEPRDHSQFLNSKGMLPPDTDDPNIFTRYINTGSAGRFENLIWCIEIIGSTAHVYSWSNAGTAGKISTRKVRWDSDLKGKLIGKEVDIP